MTTAEMECCKKMAGNCDMGGGNHKCCDVTVNHSASTAAVVQHSHIHQPAVVVMLCDRIEETQLQYGGDFAPVLTTIPLSPPGASTVLRI
jgi:hypothetical protein